MRLEPAFEAGQRRAGVLRGRDAEEGVEAGEVAEVGCCAQGRVQGDAGQEDRVLVARVDGIRDLGLKRPEEDRLALAGQHLRDGGAPGAGADNADFLEMRCHGGVVAQAGLGGKRCFSLGA